MSSVENPAGNYRYVPGISPYSAGVLATADHRIVRMRLPGGVDWRFGFELIDQTLDQYRRPSTALCAVELRCPAPHSFNGFGSFNDEYRQALEVRGILLSDGTNPVARTNVAPDPAVSPEQAKDTELHAFSFTIETASLIGTADTRPSFVISGAGDLVDQADLRPEAIVGGTTAWSESGDARASAVLGEMEERLTSLGLTWADTDTAVLYSVEEVRQVLANTILPRLGEAAINGVHWHYCRPPIEGLMFEMDTRGGVIERRGTARLAG